MSDKVISRAVGEEMRRTREAKGWSRNYLVTRLPSGIGARTLLSYEHGTRHLTLLRFIEVCRALGVVLFSVVTGVMDSTVDDKLILDNPCKAKTIRRPTSPAVEVKDIWPEERVKAVCEGMEERWRITVVIGAGLGLRQGEILGLSPDDIDEESMLLHVRRQLRTVDRKLVFALPKGNKTRTVPLSPGVLAEIRDHLADYPATTATLPWRKTTGDPTTVRLLTTGEGGRLYTGDLFTKTSWEAAFGTAKLTRAKQVDGMHALRHFYASTLLAQGVSIKELATYLGHSDPGFTLRVYTHLVPSSHQRARQAVDTVFGRPDTGDGLEAA